MTNGPLVVWFGGHESLSTTQSAFLVFEGEAPHYIAFCQSESVGGPPASLEGVSFGNDHPSHPHDHDHELPNVQLLVAVPRIVFVLVEQCPELCSVLRKVLVRVASHRNWLAKHHAHPTPDVRNGETELAPEYRQ